MNTIIENCVKKANTLLEQLLEKKPEDVKSSKEEDLVVTIGEEEN
jgi:hypothetical protein